MANDKSQTSARRVDPNVEQLRTVQALFEELQWQMAQTDLPAEPSPGSNRDFNERVGECAHTKTEVGETRQSPQCSEQNTLNTLRRQTQGEFFALGIEQATAVRVVFDNGDTGAYAIKYSAS